MNVKSMFVHLYDVYFLFKILKVPTVPAHIILPIDSLLDLLLCLTKSQLTCKIRAQAKNPHSSLCLSAAGSVPV